MIYKHLKSGKYYKFLDQVTNATNSARIIDMILYENDNGDKFVRNEEEFFNAFEATDRKDFPNEQTENY